MVCQAGATELAAGDWGIAVVPIDSVDIALSFPVFAAGGAYVPTVFVGMYALLGMRRAHTS
jgi:hypothetical protein